MRFSSLLAISHQQVPDRMQVHVNIGSNPFGEIVKAKIISRIDGQPGASHTACDETAIAGA
jgi:hypothetical protein